MPVSLKEDYGIVVLMNQSVDEGVEATGIGFKMIEER